MSKAGPNDPAIRLTELIRRAAARALELSRSPGGREDDLDDVFQGIATLISEVIDAPIPNRDRRDAILEAAVAVRKLGGASFVEARQRTEDARTGTDEAREKLDAALSKLEEWSPIQ